MGKSSKRKKALAAQAKKQKQPAALEQHSKPLPEENKDDSNISMGDLDPEHEQTDDETPIDKKHRHKRPSIDDWAQEIIQTLVKEQGQDIKKELDTKNPNFSKIEKIFQRANEKIKKANIENHVPVENNLIKAELYWTNYDLWNKFIKKGLAKGNPEKGWSVYDGLCSAFSMLNRQYGLPSDWNIPPNVTQRKFGAQPKDMVQPGNTSNLDSDSAVSYSDKSESKSEESDLDRFNALESKAQKEYTTLLGGKALYWWRVGTGTQIFV